MLEVAEATSDTTPELDDPVDGLGATVACPAGVGLRQERVPPAAQRLTRSGDLRDRAPWQLLDQRLGLLSTALSGRGLVNDIAQVLAALVGDLDGHMLRVRSDRCTEPGLLARVRRSRPAWRTWRIP